MTRRLQIWGKGTVGNEIQIKIDGNIVYQGTVFNPESEFLPQPDEPQPVRIFPYDHIVTEINHPMDGATHALEIRSITGDFEFTKTFSNYMTVWEIADLHQGQQIARSSGEFGFIPCYAKDESDFAFYRDSNSNVKIDGVTQPRNPANDWERLGQWYWTIRQGQVFKSTMTVSPGFEGPPVIPDEEWDFSLQSYLIWRRDHDLPL
jgi:hypothetical protein